MGGANRGSWPDISSTNENQQVLVWVDVTRNAFSSGFLLTTSLTPIIFIAVPDEAMGTYAERGNLGSLATSNGAASLQGLTWITKLSTNYPFLQFLTSEACITHIFP